VEYDIDFAHQVHEITCRKIQRHELERLPIERLMEVLKLLRATVVGIKAINPND
jgi:hypothetical protein